MKYFISYGLGGGFGGATNHTVEEFDTKDKAWTEAYELACQEYEQYEDIHGIRSVDTIMREDDLDYQDASEVYEEEKESWLSYSAVPYSPEKHDSLL